MSTGVADGQPRPAKIYQPACFHEAVSRGAGCGYSCRHVVSAVPSTPAVGASRAAAEASPARNAVTDLKHKTRKLSRKHVWKAKRDGPQS